MIQPELRPCAPLHGPPRPPALCNSPRPLSACACHATRRRAPRAAGGVLLQRSLQRPLSRVQVHAEVLSRRPRHLDLPPARDLQLVILPHRARMRRQRAPLLLYFPPPLLPRPGHLSPRLKYETATGETSALSAWVPSRRACSRRSWSRGPCVRARRQRARH
jgi:hypothetical protein